MTISRKTLLFKKAVMPIYRDIFNDSLLFSMASFSIVHNVLNIIIPTQNWNNAIASLKYIFWHQPHFSVIENNKCCQHNVICQKQLYLLMPYNAVYPTMLFCQLPSTSVNNTSQKLYYDYNESLTLEFSNSYIILPQFYADLA